MERARELGAGPAEPQAPAPPPPSHVSWAPGSHPRHVRRVSSPWGHVERVLRPLLLGVTWEGAPGTRAAASFDRPGDRDLREAAISAPSLPTHPHRVVPWNRPDLFPTWPRN